MSLGLGRLAHRHPMSNQGLVFRRNLTGGLVMQASKSMCGPDPIISSDAGAEYLDVVPKPLLQASLSNLFG